MGEGLSRVQGRKWQLTINNPKTHGLDHTTIKANLEQFKGLLYYCLCDEIGDECETDHTHVYFVLRNPCTAERINNLFPKVHRERVAGTSAENRAYVLKDGPKYNKQEDGTYSYTDSSGKDHNGVNYSATFEEWGEMPQEQQGKSKASETIVAMVKDGASNMEIVNAVAVAYKDLDKIERMRSMYRDASFATKWRDLEVTYIFGPSGVGKTRSVMDAYGYDSVYRVTDYKHPFDTYDGQDVIIFEEFRGGLKHGDMLNYLDGYPLLLPCRYFNRQACYTKVFIITNIPPDEQYQGIDQASREAFFRRFTLISRFKADGSVDSWKSYREYENRYDWVNQLHDGVDEQISL